MILYKLAKWMEERANLRMSIAQSEGDTRHLEHKKELVEEQMLAEAAKWLSGSAQPDLKQAVTEHPEAFIAESGMIAGESGRELALSNQ